MEPKAHLSNINSKHIFNVIFEFIKDPNFHLKLFKHSKKYQKILDISIVDYEKTFLKNHGIDFNNYLFSIDNIFLRKFDKETLNNNLEKDCKKHNIDKSIIKKALIDIYTKKYEQEYKHKENHEEIKELVEVEVPIEIYSPFLNDIAQTEMYESLFTMALSTYLIEKLDLRDDYINKFYELNMNKAKYNSLTIYYEDSYDILFLKEFKINFKQIKRLNFIPNSYIVTGDYKYFLNTFYTLFNGMENHLIQLRLKWVRNEIEPKLMEKINKFKSLKLLNLTGFKFTSNFLLDIPSLKKLTLDNCQNISFSNNSFLNLKKLLLNDCFINKSESILEAPNIEECKLTYINTINEYKYFQILNLHNFQKLKKLVVNPDDFIHIENDILENLELISIWEIDSDIQKQIMEKIVNLKHLKEIKFEYGKIDYNYLANIKSINSNANKLVINYSKYNDDLMLYDLQRIFPNIDDLCIYIPRCQPNNEINLEIKENKLCKINKFVLKAGLYKNINFYCTSYEKLIEVRINLYDRIKNINNSFPLFNKDNTIIFKSLKIFEFTNKSENKIAISVLESINNNLNKMPNLIELFLDCKILHTLKKHFYDEFLINILKMKLKKIHFSIKSNIDQIYTKEDIYDKSELEELFKQLNINNINLDNVYIRKFNSNSIEI